VCSNRAAKQTALTSGRIAPYSPAVVGTLGAAGEGLERYAMVALNIPSEAGIPAIKQLLREGQRDGWWE
jgi:hypothetical protein